MKKDANSGKSAIIENFQPMPKRFMVWDKNNLRFMMVGEAYPLCQLSEGMKGSTVFSLQDLVALFSEILYYDNSDDYIICQSTNLFDKDGEEIFEGSIVKDFDDEIGVVQYDSNEGAFLVNGANGDQWELADSNIDAETLGHILSNPELLEERK